MVSLLVEFFLPAARTDRSQVIDAYSELQTEGQFGRLALTLLLKITREELRRFPVLLAAGQSVDNDIVNEWAQRFFAAAGRYVTEALLTQTRDLASMSAYLRRSVRNFLVTEARQTPYGAVRRKLEDLLKEHPDDFQKVPTHNPGAGWWHLADGGREPFGGDLRDLVRAAYSVHGVRAVQWTGARRAPLASDKSLIEILRAVLSRAGGALSIGDLAQVFHERFKGGIEAADALLEEKTYDSVAADLEDQPDTGVLVTDEARTVHAQLSASQRALLPHLDKPVSEQMEILRLGRSQTHVFSSRLKATMIELISDDDLRGLIAEEVLRLCIVIS